MEDDLEKKMKTTSTTTKNGRRPTKIIEDSLKKMEDDLNKILKREDDLKNKIKMEDDLKHNFKK
jgi:hypothetical protein